MPHGVRTATMYILDIILNGYSAHMTKSFFIHAREKSPLISLRQYILPIKLTATFHKRVKHVNLTLSLRSGTMTVKKTLSVDG